MAGKKRRSQTRCRDVQPIALHQLSFHSAQRVRVLADRPAVSQEPDENISTHTRKHTHTRKKEMNIPAEKKRRKANATMFYFDGCSRSTPSIAVKARGINKKAALVQWTREGIQTAGTSICELTDMPCVPDALSSVGATTPTGVEGFRAGTLSRETMTVELHSQRYDTFHLNITTSRTGCSKVAMTPQWFRVTRMHHAKK